MNITIYNQLSKKLFIAKPKGWQLYWNTLVSPFCTNYVETYRANKRLQARQKDE